MGSRNTLSPAGGNTLPPAGGITVSYAGDGESETRRGGAGDSGGEFEVNG